MNPLPGQKSLPLFLFLPPGIVLMIHAYLGSFTRLMADDFCSYNDAQRFHILRYIWYSYKVWAGRYSAVASDEILDTIGPMGVRYIPMLILLVWSIASYLMCQTVLQRSTSNKPSAWLSASLGLILVFTFSATSPGFDKLLYWWNGMRTYVPALISVTFHIAFLYWAADRVFTKGNLIIASAFSFLLAMFGGGFNETFTAVQFLGFSAIIGLWAVTKRLRPSDPVSSMLGAAWLGTAAALTIMVISPGAAQRRMIFSPAPPDVITMFDIAINGYADYVYEMINSPEQVAVWIGLFLAFFWTGIHLRANNPNRWSILLAVIGGVVLSFVSLLPSAYGLSGMPGARTFSVPTYAIILSVSWSGFLIGARLTATRFAFSSGAARTGLTVVMFIFIALTSLLNAKSLYANREVYISYAQLWDEVDSTIKEAKANGEPSITIPAMGGWARLDRPNENPKFWATKCYSDYYGIQVFGPPYGP